MLVVRDANDPGQSMRRAVIVRYVEPVEGDHALSTRREMHRRRTPHRPRPDDDHVVPHLVPRVPKPRVGGQTPCYMNCNRESDPILGNCEYTRATFVVTLVATEKTRDERSEPIADRLERIPARRLGAPQPLLECVQIAHRQ